MTQASANVERFFARTAESTLGQPIERVLGEGVGQQVRAMVAAQSLEQNPSYLRTLSLAGGEAPLNAIIHRNGDVVILELEPASSADAASFQQLYPLVRTFVNRLTAMRDVREICRLAAEEVRRITGFDRVLVYRSTRRGTAGRRRRIAGRRRLRSFWTCGSPRRTSRAGPGAVPGQPAPADRRRGLRPSPLVPAHEPEDRAAARPELRVAAERLADPRRVHA